MCNVSIWRSGLLINAGPVGLQWIRLLYVRSEQRHNAGHISQWSQMFWHFFALFPRRYIDCGDTPVLLLDVMFTVGYLHISTSPLWEPAGAPACRGEHHPQSSSQTEAIHSHNSSSQKSLNAADNWIEESGSQCLQPSTEGQLSQT